MDSLRHLLNRNRALAALVLACALAMKLLVPAGYMPGGQTMILTLSICADATGGTTVRKIAVPMKPGHGHVPGEPAGTDAVCPFAAAALAMAGGADAPLLAIALAFIVLLGLVGHSAPAPRAAPYLRPPLRGPPRTV
jgi:hypothetical protein